MVDLKKLAIVTSAYTANTVWPNEKDILDYVATRMPGNWTDLKQIRANLPDIKQRIQEEFTTLWSGVVQEALQPTDAEKLGLIYEPVEDKMIYRVLQLDENTIHNLEDFAETSGMTVEQIISEMVVKAFGNLMAVEVEA